MWVGAVHLLSLTPTDPPTNTLTLYLYIIKISAWNSFIQLITNPNLMAHKLSKILYSSMKKDQEIKPKYDFFMTQQDRSKTTVTCEKWFDSSIDYYLNSLYILQTNMKKQQYIDLISLDFNWLKLHRCVFTIIIISLLYVSINSVLNFSAGN